MRAVIYARYSSELQREASIEDQIEVCRRYAEQHGWVIVAHYDDRALSGASRFRPGYQRLVADLSSGRFDVVLVEALDRLSRKLADIAEFHDRLSFARVKLMTVTQGEITALHIGVLGMMAQLFLSDLSEKVKRGQLGRARAGKQPGGKAYGYDVVVPASGAEGGERRINDAEAAVVRRIFEEFAGGRSPRGIAKRLNDDGVPGPGRRSWGDTTIRGQAERATGILNNALYVGRLEWNRCAYIRNPQTGRRVARPNLRSTWEVVEVPQLRIVDDALWQKVKARQEQLSFTVGRDENGNALNRAHRTKYLLSGLMLCGGCGAPYVAQGQGRFACSRHRRGGRCDNAAWIDVSEIEARVLAGLKEKLLAPELVASFVAELEREIAEQHRRASTRAKEHRVRLQACIRQIDNVVTAVADARSSPALLAKLSALEAEKAQLENQVVGESTPILRLPAPGSALYRRKVETLEAALRDETIRPEAMAILRSLIDKVVVKPAADGTLQVELHGEMAALLMTAASDSTPDAKRPTSGEDGRAVLSVVAGGGFEPPTFRL
jgi:DNA invertase Pin-like site-specific DNA recombinase